MHPLSVTHRDLQWRPAPVPRHTSAITVQNSAIYYLGLIKGKTEGKKKEK